MIILLLLMINIPIQGIMILFYFINFLTRFRGLFFARFLNSRDLVSFFPFLLNWNGKIFWTFPFNT